jgi:hypothetical protein
LVVEEQDLLVMDRMEINLFFLQSHQLVVEEVVGPPPLETLEVLEVVGVVETALNRVVPEILHQHHHHKEMLVDPEMGHPAWRIMSQDLVAALVVRALVFQMQLRHRVDKVVLDYHLPSPEHQ